jgi:hypothetical protein
MTSHANRSNRSKEDSSVTSTDPASVPTSARASHTASSPRLLLRALNWGPAQVEPPTLRWTVNLLAWGGSILVLLSGLIHIKLWASGYQDISVIGPLFLAQGIAGILLALALGVFRRLWLIVAGAGYCVATAAGLLISVNFGLLGFRDSLAVPYATSSMVEEFIGGGVLLLTAVAFLAARPWRRRMEQVWPPAS